MAKEKRFYTLILTGTVEDWARSKGAFRGHDVWLNYLDTLPGGNDAVLHMCRMLGIDLVKGQSQMSIEAEGTVLDGFEAWRIGRAEASQLPFGAVRLRQRIGPDTKNPLDPYPVRKRRMNQGDIRPDIFPAEVVR